MKTQEKCTNILGSLSTTIYRGMWHLRCLNKDITVKAPEEMKPSRFVHPCNCNLYKIKKNSPLLDPKREDLFHRLVARLLFASKRARPNIQVTVAFLCTRVNALTEEDYQKIGRPIRYVKETINLPLILELDGLETLFCNVNAL